ncbi:MAG: hypothetical protein WD066_01635 [Planctomycetaceae bacterium]
MTDPSRPFDRFPRSAPFRNESPDDCAASRPCSTSDLNSEEDETERFPELLWLERMFEEPRPGYPREWRDQRLMDYLAETLGRPGALGANIGGTNADVMWLSQRVMAFLERWQPDLDDDGFDTLRVLIESLGHVHEQLARLTTLDTRLTLTTPNPRRRRRKTDRRSVPPAGSKARREAKSP